MRLNHTGLWTYFLLLVAGALILLNACGSKSNPSDISTTDTGILHFNLVYLNASDNMQALEAAIDCSGEGIATVEAMVYNSVGKLLANGGPWNCDAGRGTISSVPAGSGRIIVILGKDAAGNVIFRGEKHGIDIYANSENNAGTIDCYLFVPSLLAPANGAPVNADTMGFAWGVVAGASQYRVIVSVNGNLSVPIIDETVTAENYTPTGLAEDQTYYWQVVAGDSYANQGVGSTIWWFSIDAEHVNNPPDAYITSPSEGSTFTVGDDIQFEGSGIDAEDGSLTGAFLVWRSDLDGQIGTGVNFTRNDLSVGTHTITLTATDSGGDTAADAHSIAVLPSEWVKLLGSAGYDRSNGIAVDTNGDTYITGHTWGSLDGNTNAGEYDIFVSKYDISGNMIWTRQLGTTKSDYGNGIAVDTNGNAYITGYTEGDLDGNTNAGDSDIFVSKYGTSGNRIWTRLLGTKENDYGYGIAVDTNGNAYITGYTWGDLDGNTNAGAFDIFVSKYDTSGNRIWTRQTGSTEYDRGYGIAMDTNGNAYITGDTEGDLDGNTNAGGFDIFVSKYDTSGNRIWTGQPGSTEYDRGYGIAVDTNGNAYITGDTGGDLDGNANAGGWDIFVSKYDTSGNKIWTRLLGTTLSDNGYGIAVDTNGNAYITGDARGNLDGNTNAGNRDIFVSKYDTSGNRLWTSLLGTTTDDCGYGIAVDTNSNACITGFTDGDLDGNTNAGSHDIFIWRLPDI
ncbi:MAG: SBBP repeat-containing protein [Desulfobacteraceae bacterium]|jgi:hypothetical protein